MQERWEEQIQAACSGVKMPAGWQAGELKVKN